MAQVAEEFEGKEQHLALYLLVRAWGKDDTISNTKGVVIAGRRSISMLAHDTGMHRDTVIATLWLLAKWDGFLRIEESISSLNRNRIEAIAIPLMMNSQIPSGWYVYHGDRVEPLTQFESQCPPDTIIRKWFDRQKRLNAARD
jgi:hypothetical protein